MIIYDQTKWSGLYVLFHTTGSALLKWRTIVPALLFSALTFGLTFSSGISDFLTSHLEQTVAYFSSLTFLISMVLVTRTTAAMDRWNRAQFALVTFGARIYELAMLSNAWLLVGEEESPQDANRVFARNTILRWVQATYVLALEELHGHKASKRYVSVLTMSEELLLAREKKRPLRVLNWINIFITRNRHLFQVGDPVFCRLFVLTGEIHSQFVDAKRIADTPYAFPLAQLAVMCAWAFSLVSPFFWAAAFPQSVLLSAVVCFMATWILMACNEAAVELEAPFDGERNSIALGHYYYETTDDIFAIQARVPNMECKVPTVVVDGSGTALDENVNGPTDGDGGNAHHSSTLSHDRTHIMEQNKANIKEYLDERRKLRKQRNSWWPGKHLQKFTSSFGKDKGQFDDTANPAELRVRGEFGTML